jgi:hypothetical protein
MIVGIAIVVVKPPSIVIVIDIEYIEVTGNGERMYEAPPVPLPVEISSGCILFGILNTLAPHTK